MAALLIVVLSITTIGATTAETFPEVIPLPNGIAPEGIASGKGSTFYVGSIPTGAVYAGDFRTGGVELLVPAQEGRAAIGMKFDPRSNLLFVAGGPTGKAFIYNGLTGATVAVIQLATSTSTFVNDVVITRDAAYFTESFQPVLYRVALDRSTGQPLDPNSGEVIPLSGDFVFVAGFNTNGIDATPNGKTLIIVNSTTGLLYTVDPETGVATLIDLGGATVQRGDGILLHGKTLYVVQNTLNQFSVIRLSADLSSGEIVDVITSDFFRVPTTIAEFGSALYAVNARFGTPVTPDTEYEVVRVSR
jgi:sugar lactone lactonase YvrE